ncbi:MAG: ATPase [Chitinophagales bacterium]|nr:ATPase [Bacteroidota bacterium]MBP8753295.1 ATPase [Chitinophagales bacterium]MBP9188414.1 ATPase [Chitinophagales bacterium]MBP9548746.1 ATPase [Chitinophagales bacterium]MBP9704805.1 ATPase [Chitinophagales bacterium]
MGKSKKVKFTLEYMIRSTPLALYNFLTTATGLSQWFAEDVDNEENTFYFTWGKQTDIAEMISTEDDDFIRYRWDYQDEDEYFEFRIEKGDITDDTVLFITDIVDEGDVESQKQLWDAQIKSLSKRIGAA